MILLDTSVLVEYFRSPAGPLPDLFKTIRPTICGVVRAELLHGARNPSHMTQLRLAIDQLPQLHVPADIWDELGTNLCTLRLNGLTVPFADALLATIAIRAGAELWTYDRHHTLILNVLPKLRLFQQPP
jgi:predicted nucleic acid-binding protein